MAVKRVQSDIDVVTAAKQRIKNVFYNGVPVYLSFSGGKDNEKRYKMKSYLQKD